MYERYGWPVVLPGGQLRLPAAITSVPHAAVQAPRVAAPSLPAMPRLPPTGPPPQATAPAPAALQNVRAFAADPVDVPGHGRLTAFAALRGAGLGCEQWLGMTVAQQAFALRRAYPIPPLGDQSSLTALLVKITATCVDAAAAPGSSPSPRAGAPVDRGYQFPLGYDFFAGTPVPR